MSTEKLTFAQRVANDLIDMIAKGTAPWQRPWEVGEGVHVLPINPVTGNRYRGINAINLFNQTSLGGLLDNRWMTYKQAQSIDAQVRKGERGTTIQFWQFTRRQDKLDDNGNKILNENGEPIKETIRLRRPIVRYSTVFNGSQIDGLPEFEKPSNIPEWEVNERAQAIVELSGATIKHDQLTRAFYRPSSDSIHLPQKSQFKTEGDYYGTLFHELGHWTGHESRLDRELGYAPYGSIDYAKEELRAEIASFMIAMEIGLPHNPERHASYTQSWLKALKDDSNEIIRAATDAEKATQFILEFERHAHTHTDEQTQNQQENTNTFARVRATA